MCFFKYGRTVYHIKSKTVYIYIYICIFIYLFIYLFAYLLMYFLFIYLFIYIITSSTAQGGGGSFRIGNL